MLILHHGNRLEVLADELARLLAEQPLAPLCPEVIITQSQGMAHWLSLHLARTLGVAASLRFPLPGAYVWEVFQLHVDDEKAAGFERGTLLWRVFGLLPGLLADPHFVPLRDYLKDVSDEGRRFRLSRQIADVFDQYLVYRWSMLLDWEAGVPSGDWQSVLWRALVSQAGLATHRARLFKRLCELEPDPARLPSRLIVFGLTSLPPAYLAVLEWLARACEVRVFLPNPCREYWGDIEDRRTLERWQTSRPGRALHQDVGHPLLAALGKQGRDFIRLLYDSNRLLEEREHFAEPEAATLLHGIQADILKLRETVAGEGDSVADDSIQFHDCHGPLREVQVLHDRLLDMFERDPSLTPGDVVVMVPAIERYAPLAEAVFAVRDHAAGLVSQRSTPRLPCAIADRASRNEHALLEVYLRLLGLPDSRLGAAEVFEWLETPAIRARFELDGEALEILRLWIAESGIRWGLDGESKKAWQLPDEPHHTWRFGLDRLLLGYALAPDVDFCLGIAPYHHVEGQPAQALGRLAQFVEQLESFRRRLAVRQSVKEWVVLLRALGEAFFAPGDEDEAAWQILMEALAALEQSTEEAEFEGDLSLPVVAEFMQSQFEEVRHGGGFLTGRITFCSLMPMRSIPFKVVCLLGMNDVDYPRRRHAPGFDLIAQEPQPGDRSRREDDRYLFLEALLSARQRLYISYVGHSNRDNSEQQPSVLVRELQEVIAARLGLPFKADGVDRASQLKRLGLIVEHPLQPFSPRNFDGGDRHLFSYGEVWAERADPPAPFFADALATPPEPSLLDVDLEMLTRFFRNPSAYFLRHRLGLRFGEEAQALEETEPFALAGLDRYHLTEQTVVRMLAGDFDDGSALQGLKAEGQLPQGIFGELRYRAMRDEARAFVQRLEPSLPASLETLTPVQLGVGDLHFRARLTGVGPDGVLHYRVGLLRPIDRLSLWLKHLVLQLAGLDQAQRRSRYISKDTQIAYPPLATQEAERWLSDMLALYRLGLDEPLPFFPQAAYAYAAAINNQRSEDSAWAAALKSWRGDLFLRRAGEGESIAVATAFRGRDPFSDTLRSRFAGLALQVYTPLLGAVE